MNPDIPNQQAQNEMPVIQSNLQQQQIKEAPLGNIFKIILLIIILLIAVGGAFYFLAKKTQNPIACTKEAKICSDGSTVGRTGSNCEFAPCPQIDSLLSEAEARIIAEKSSCIKDRETLTKGIYNKISKTWWFDANLNEVKKGCNPACVVSEETKTAEINWRCTGLLRQ